MKSYFINYQTVRADYTAKVEAVSLAEAILNFIENHSDKFIKINYVMFPDENYNVKKVVFNLKELKSE